MRKYNIPNFLLFLAAFLALASPADASLRGVASGPAALASSDITTTGTVTAAGFVPTATTATGNRLYLPASNTLGLAINGSGEVQLTATALTPVASDGNALGTASLMWGDLFLASGGVINFNSDMTITHGADILTFAGGTVALGTATISAGTITGITDIAVADGGTGASTAAAARANLGAVGSITYQVFTADGTYTPNANLIYAQIHCIGGGGGGGGATSSATGISVAGGGGSGSYCVDINSAATIGASQAVDIGALGAGGTAGANNGSNGADSSIGTLCVAKGGSGGGGAGTLVGATGGAAGVAGTGDVAKAGGNGGSAAGASVTTVQGVAGFGANSLLGGGGRQVVCGATNAAGSAAETNTGGGGSGACVQASASNAAGGNGAAGICWVVEFNSQ